MNATDKQAPSDHQIGRPRASGPPFAAWPHPHRPGVSVPSLLALLREIPFPDGRQRSETRQKLPESFYSKALKRTLPGGAEIAAKDHLTRNARCLI